MTRKMMLRLAAKRKDAHAATYKRIADAKAAALRQWELDIFSPKVIGLPPIGMTNAEYSKIIEEATLNKRNVFFGSYDGLEARRAPRGENILDVIANIIWP